MRNMPIKRYSGMLTRLTHNNVEFADFTYTDVRTLLSQMDDGDTLIIHCAEQLRPLSTHGTI